MKSITRAKQPGLTTMPHDTKAEPAACPNADFQALLQEYVTPLAPYFIADHYIATELIHGNRKYVGCDFRPSARDFLANQDVSGIASGDIVQVQVDLLAWFVAAVLPLLRRDGKRITLLTSQWWMPAVERSDLTDSLLRDPSIALWISQNPIYESSDSYMAFPYGLLHLTLPAYVSALKANTAVPRIRRIINLPTTVHPHLPHDHIRRRYNRLGKESGPEMPYEQYLDAIRKSCFAISTEGDRPDTYRHYECIGLGAIPVSTLPSTYAAIFGDSMLIRDAEGLLDALDRPETLPQYHTPDSRIISLPYWKERIHQWRHFQIGG